MPKRAGMTVAVGAVARAETARCVKSTRAFALPSAAVIFVVPTGVAVIVESVWRRSDAPRARVFASRSVGQMCVATMDVAGCAGRAFRETPVPTEGVSVFRIVRAEPADPMVAGALVGRDAMACCNAIHVLAGASRLVLHWIVRGGRAGTMGAAEPVARAATRATIAKRKEPVPAPRSVSGRFAVMTVAVALVETAQAEGYANPVAARVFPTAPVAFVGTTDVADLAGFARALRLAVPLVFAAVFHFVTGNLAAMTAAAGPAEPVGRRRAAMLGSVCLTT